MAWLKFLKTYAENGEEPLQIDFRAFCVGCSRGWFQHLLRNHWTWWRRGWWCWCATMAFRWWWRKFWRRGGWGWHVAWDLGSFTTRPELSYFAFQTTRLRILREYLRRMELSERELSFYFHYVTEKYRDRKKNLLFYLFCPKRVTFLQLYVA